jgi:putative intracellular protease/amidase
MTRKTVFYFVFDGFADWEASHALAGINKSNKFRIVTIGLDKNPKRSMAGIDVLPAVDFIPWVDLRDIDALNTAMLILPGGSGWRDAANDRIADLVCHCIRHQIPVAAIGEAVMFLTELDVAVYSSHTDYLPVQRDRAQYEGIITQAIPDTDIITADGTAAIEFTRTIFEALKIANDENVRQWFQYFESSPA